MISKRSSELMQVLGTDGPTKTDEFSEKFQTTPPLIFGKSCCGFFPEFMTEEPLIMAKICNINFWIENDPPSELFRKFIRFGGAIRP